MKCGRERGEAEPLLRVGEGEMAKRIVKEMMGTRENIERLRLNGFGGVGMKWPITWYLR